MGRRGRVPVVIPVAGAGAMRGDRPPPAETLFSKVPHKGQNPASPEVNRCHKSGEAWERVFGSRLRLIHHRKHLAVQHVVGLKLGIFEIHVVTGNVTDIEITVVLGGVAHRVRPAHRIARGVAGVAVDRERVKRDGYIAESDPGTPPGRASKWSHIPRFQTCCPLT